MTAHPDPAAAAPPDLVFTGLGAVASVGSGVDEIFEALCAGRSGRAELRGFDPVGFRARHAYEIDDRPAPGTDEPGRATRWLIAAIAEAAHDAGLGEDLSEVPVLIGTGLRELRSAELRWRDGADFDMAELHFGTALRERFGAVRTHTFSNACSASLYALAMGSDLLAAQEADTVIVAGVDTLTESMYGLLDRVHMEAPDRLRPFDRDRKGVLMGEGAAAVVLRRNTGTATGTGTGTSTGTAAGRGGGAVRGRLRSVHVNCDGYHVTAPDRDGIAEAVRGAHREAGVKPEDIGLVMLHGTGTLLNDEAEAAAIGDVFGPQAGTPLMTAVKSMTGHTSGGSGLLSLIVALKALDSGRVPPTIGLREPIEEAAAFRIVRDREAAAEAVLAQVDAFGFGGVNAVAVVERAVW
ncbi:beta-ketoacyl synthase N-terminal-like domain-containing protein [Streptomyces sp. NBC_01408]|uniref:beta-ketoacyl synthase N-terminal-like domain-containing protein n=1 Tax=Streptomyces sp. NBC_01408 TaxID=2903855 RepID=UPI002252462A|nr:beta-ketoacyl synthase N-terminal-like domain-containing protein [Streptomyces sp. NBC_01408]MCX4693181.1 3-oxoacyl-ACP synthase [Streptomyces sp. NBC_01408]